VSASRSTHVLSFTATTVTKTYRSWQRGEHQREWSALQLLDEHSPGLAPAPVDADLDGEQPSITMSRLPGTPMDAAPLNGAGIAALAHALRRLHDAIPAGCLTALGPRLWSPADAISDVGAMLAAAEYAEGAPDVVHALAIARTWFAETELEPHGAEADHVFGLADGNLANYLWDGERVRLVDFEDSGVSDRGFELADTLEHPSSFLDNRVDPEALIEALDLDSLQRQRVDDFRRLFACFWLVKLLPGGSAHHRNPAGSLERCARHTTALLG
jgi:aminoglycoside phosphotransferase